MPKAELNFALFPKQLAALNSPATEILFGGAAGPGKALAIDTPIPTPSGWRSMGDLRPGDVVFDEVGEPCNVLAVTPTMFGRPCYRVDFEGVSIVADAEHEWLTQDLGERAAAARRTNEFREARRARRPSRATGKKPWLAVVNAERKYEYKAPTPGSVRTTKQIADTLIHRGRTNHAVTLSPGIAGEEINLPIDPYVLGVWLGDGTSSQGAFTSSDPEVADEIRRRGYEVTKRASRFGYGILGLVAQLKSLGLLNDKRIPNIYLRASRGQRLDLLRGLMDTDGTVAKDGSCQFDNCNEGLAEACFELAVSLGIKAHFSESRSKLRGEDCGPKYRVSFSTSTRVFNLKRKRDRQIVSERGVQKRRMIKGADPVESVPVRCIQVDSPSSMYLAGEAMIPTHNSHLLRVAAIVWCLAIPGLQFYLFRRTRPDLWKNHMEGPQSLPVLLAPLIEAGACKLNLSDGRIELGRSRIHLCHCEHESDVYKYQGAEMHVLAPDELTHFTQSQYAFLRSRVRMVGLPIPERFAGRFPRVIAGSNPGNVGHNWVKSTFIDPAPPMTIFRAEAKDGGMLRQFVPALKSDNPALLRDDPNYGDRLSGLGSEALVRAMLEGDWNIVAGGALDDVWRADRHVLPRFEIPFSWPLDRSFDWGSSKPFSVGWWAQSTGEAVEVADGVTRIFPKGTLFRIAELYGWNGVANEGCRKTASEIAREILAAEKEMGISGRVRPGPADPSIFAIENGTSIADDMARVGVKWIAAEAGPGSRINGLARLRGRLKASLVSPMEEPGIFFFDTCRHAIRTLPVLPRDERKPEDVNTAAEDHVYDETRYRATWKAPTFAIAESASLIGV